MVRRGNDDDKTVVEVRGGTGVYRSGMRLRTKVLIPIGIFIAVGILVNVLHLFGH